MAYLKAIEAGVDTVDTAISPFALGTSQPPTETIVTALKGTPYDTGLDLQTLNKIAEYFKPLREKYISNHMLDPKALGVDVNALVYQIPGGMFSNLVSQLKQLNKMDKYDEVLKEIPNVRRDLGYPPLVTPTSQLVGSQAVFNVISGERYSVVPMEVKAYVRGEYGRPPVEISDEIKEKIIGNESPISRRPADLLEPQLEKSRNEIKKYIEQEEDVLSYALFPDVAIDFFNYRTAKKYNVDTSLVGESDGVTFYPV
jgi:oxaloacetate decarboxylase alpha subunit